MRTIISRTIGSEVSPRISIGADEIYRPLNVGGNWGKLRIGVSMIMTYPGANIGGTPRLFIGVCSRYKSWGSWNAHALGVVTSAATMTANAGPPINFSIQPMAVLVVGQTETAVSGAAGGNLIAATTARHYYLLIIDKTGGNVRMQHLTSSNSISGVYDISPPFARDLTEMETPTASSFSLGTFNTTAILNEAVNGPLDCVNIGWSNTAAPVEINEINVSYSTV